MPMTDHSSAILRVADLLAERDVPVADQEPWRGRIAVPGGSLSVDDDGSVEWYLRPRDARPAAMVRASLRLLAAVDRPVSCGTGSFNRAIADGLTAAGMSVAMKVYTDRVAMEAFAGLVVTNPERLDRGTAYVDDERELVWVVDAPSGQFVPLPEVADTIVDVLAGTGW
ncbi:hypothetical protein SAMN05421810_101604 [Amycolatopsis arida]|uniref:Uncharacterized protein n=1 Tax=Amycolatopsis arida TaxID=587909 RepID=A0A1I5LN85_9PSEU|nr:hypothetical protein [Amycolatopsis arida]TDX93781.1 hypothetical protein CLV69_104237 [Amycolatopsis arida]SFO98740.1 hypothetical protein SAMN05421810_101604 [Amycolatopsis arida]